MKKRVHRNFIIGECEAFVGKPTEEWGDIELVKVSDLLASVDLEIMHIEYNNDFEYYKMLDTTQAQLSGATGAEEELEPELKPKDIQSDRKFKTKAVKELNECMLCGKPTAGSVGRAGIKWTRICQSCKDNADSALLNSVENLGYAIKRLLREG